MNMKILWNLSTIVTQNGVLQQKECMTFIPKNQAESELENNSINLFIEAPPVKGGVFYLL